MSPSFNLGIVWAQYGPYHFARAAALRQRAGANVHAIEIANQTSVYAWNRKTETDALTTLCPGSVFEELSFWKIVYRARRVFKELDLDACLLPGYAPKQHLAVLLAAQSLRVRTVMMNESHAGTSRARRSGNLIKRQLVGLFDSALVGGHPQKRYAASLGLPTEKIFLGYDAVDNDHFANRADAIRARADEFRAQFLLPGHYFLSLGRFVAKKNLSALIRAYRLFLNSNPSSRTHLVMVGSGEDDSSLRKLCQELRLPVYDKTKCGSGTKKTAKSNESRGVHFYGFRQIEQNPIFYALADAFILPSLWEEWGLVVNEAMACGLPVVVSETAGCAEDLLVAGRLPAPAGFPEILRESLAHLAGRIRRNGFVFNPHSARSLAHALLLLESSPELRQRMGRASRAIVDKFSCENFAQNAMAAVQVAMGDSSVVNVAEEDELLPSKASQ